MAGKQKGVRSTAAQTLTRQAAHPAPPPGGLLRSSDTCPPCWVFLLFGRGHLSVSPPVFGGAPWTRPSPLSRCCLGQVAGWGRGHAGPPSTDRGRFPPPKRCFTTLFTLVIFNFFFGVKAILDLKYLPLC